MSELLHGSIWLAAAFLLGIAVELLLAPRKRIGGWGNPGGCPNGDAVDIRGDSDPGFPEQPTTALGREALAKNEDTSGWDGGAGRARVAGPAARGRA